MGTHALASELNGAPLGNAGGKHALYVETQGGSSVSGGKHVFRTELMIVRTVSDSAPATDSASATVVSGIPTPTGYTQVAGSSGSVASYTGGSNADRQFVANTAMTVRRIDFDVFSNPVETMRIGIASAQPTSTTSVAWLLGVHNGQPVYADAALAAHGGAQASGSVILPDDIHLASGSSYWLVVINISGGTNLAEGASGTVATNLTWDTNLSLGGGTSFGTSSPDSSVPLIRLFAPTY